MIQKIIHQVYLGFDNPIMPEDWKRNHEKWKELHPDYTFMLWDMQSCVELIKEIAPSFLEVFQQYPANVQRADAVRPFILLKYGGIYTDLDTYPNLNVQPLVDVYFSVPDVEVAVAPSANTNTASNWFMMSKPQSMFWVSVIKEMYARRNNFYFTNHLRVMTTTGPNLIQDCIRKYNGNAVVMSIDLTNSENICGRGKHLTNYITDEHGCTWNNTTTGLINSIYCLISPLQTIPYYSWLTLVIILLILAVCCKIRLESCRKRCELR